MEVAQRVIEELRHCHAPVTGYLVSCALITEHGVYFGHNHEKENPTIFSHAETLAIEKMLVEEAHPVIKKIVMNGGGKIRKMKHYIPCYTCAQALLPYLTSETIIELLPLEGTTEDLTVTATELFSCYQDLPYSLCDGENAEELFCDIRKKTIVTEKDARFLADLACMGKQKSISFYLTGSATGRGGASTLVMQKTGRAYEDLDIIAVSSLPLETVESHIATYITAHYGACERVDRAIPSHQNPRGVVTFKAFYYPTPDKQGYVDLTVSTDFAGSFCYRQFELKNWFHQLS